MGWFSKKSDEDPDASDNNKNVSSLEDMPQLPALPALPPAPQGNPSMPSRPMPANQLPTLPNNNAGNRFSQSAIKDAVGTPQNMQVPSLPDRPAQDTALPLPPKKKRGSMTMEMDEMPRESIPSEFHEAAAHVKSNEPIFIRIDKFQKALDLLEETEEKIDEMRKNLMEIKQVREAEEEELAKWEQEINTLKTDMEKIDNDLFSRIE